MPDAQPGKGAHTPTGLMVRDALTGVYAKVALLERLEEEVHRGRRYGEPFSILMLDLDHFKSVNDAFGHARGDATLTEFVERVQSAARNSDVLFRFGGDEFVLFLPRTSHEQATVLAARLVEQISSTSFQGHPPLSLTVSVGVATLPDDGTNAQELLARADARMYDAKREGRSRVVSVDLTRDAEVLLDEAGRLVERLTVLDHANRFFDALPHAKIGTLRLTGAGGSGRSRMLRELEKLARLRGHRVVSVTGKREYSHDPLAALRAASSDAAELPTTLTDAAEIAEALLRVWVDSDEPVTTITIDQTDEVDHASLDVIRALLSGARSPAAVGVIHISSELDPAPPDMALRQDVMLAPLTREGLRAWLRSMFRWEPPVEFVEWLQERSGGLPGAVRQTLLQLVDRRLLLRNNSQWTLTEGFRSLSGASSNSAAPQARGIRSPQTALIGRESALRQLLRLMRTTNLVTLSGPGGSGKTRLAVECVLEASESFRDGVAFVALPARIAEHELPTAIAATLELHDLPGSDPWIGLARELRLRKQLIVLDGFDGVTGGAQRLSWLLEHAPDLRIVVTSRSRLHIPDEWVFHLEGLRVPKWPDPERARGFSAVQLFTERALSANPHFSMADADAPSVSRIAQLLDGSPLGLEIAAAQTATLSCREIANDLEAALEGLASYLPATPPDQQRFRAVMEQTWRLLSEASRLVLRRLAIFPLEFDVAAALRVAEAEPHDLDALVNRALITRYPTGRYQVHPLVREYALQKLDEFTSARQDVASVFAAHYLELAGQLGAQLHDPAAAPAALNRFAQELPNFRRAWTFAIAHDHQQLVLSGGLALFDFFQIRRYQADAEKMFAEAVLWFDANVATAQANTPATQFLLARYGACMLDTGRIEEGRRRLTVALAQAKQLELLEEEMFCLRTLAQLEESAGAPQAAQAHTRSLVSAARRVGTTADLVLALADAAALAVRTRQWAPAMDFMLEALQLEGPNAAQPEAWSALLEVAERLSGEGRSRLAGAVLLQIMNEPAAPPDIRLLAQRQIESLRSATAESELPAPAGAASPRRAIIESATVIETLKQP